MLTIGSQRPLFDVRRAWLLQYRVQLAAAQHLAGRANLLVRLVERYLADYRSILRANEKCRRALIETLDVFVDAGWPPARALAYRLDEMYRS